MYGHHHRDAADDERHDARPYDPLLRSSYCLDCRAEGRPGWTVEAPEAPSDLCDACGHDGVDGHDQRAVPPACYSCGCGHPAADARDRFAVVDRPTTTPEGAESFALDLASAVGSSALRADIRSGRVTLAELLDATDRGDVPLSFPLDLDAGRILVQRTRERYSSCGAHDRRDDDCDDCATLPDLTRPDLDQPPSSMESSLERARHGAAWAAVHRFADMERRARARIVGPVALYQMAGAYGIVPPVASTTGYDLSAQLANVNAAASLAVESRRR